MKTVIEMARESGIDEWWESGSEWRETFDSHLERFAELVRADERENGQKWFDAVTAQQKQAILAEREACARICDTTPPQPFRPSIEAAHAIRARKMP